MNTLKDYAIQCLKDEANALLDLIPLLTDDFERSVELIYQCKGKLIITGVGKSGHIGAKIAATMASTGTPSFFLNPLDAYHGDLGMISNDDVVLAISNSGNTDELLRIIPHLQERKIPIIAMAGNTSSLLTQNADLFLNTAVKKEACPLNLAPMSSTTAELAMGDALAGALMKRRAFKATDFAKFHPGGSLGRHLLARVRDNMNSTPLPIVTRSTKVSDAIIEISKTKQGLVVVLDGETIEGVMTDGDVRRAMQDKKDEFFDLKVEDIMSKHPITIRGIAKLTEAEQMMKKHNIHSLIVVDKEEKLLGIIDTFNCM